MIKRLKIEFRCFMFKLAKKIVRKYFGDGLTPIYASDKPYSTEIIAWEWRFYDEKYEKQRNRK